MLTTRYQDINGSAMPQATDHFGPGEVPAVYLDEYGGETVTIDVNELSTKCFDKDRRQSWE